MSMIRYTIYSSRRMTPIARSELVAMLGTESIKLNMTRVNM